MSRPSRVERRGGTGQAPARESAVAPPLGTPADFGTLKSDIVDSLLRGYRWLFDSARYKGHWDSVRGTALVAIALTYREHPGSPWLMTVRDWFLGQLRPIKVSQCPSCARTLEKDAKTCPHCQYDVDFAAWGEEVWDTAMALLALRKLGVLSNDPRLQRALHWVHSLYDVNRRRNWHDEPWETSWSLLAFLAFGPEALSREGVLDAARWLLSLQDEDGRIVSPHYTAYFLLIAGRLLTHDLPADAVPGDLERAMTAGAEKAAGYLVRVLAPETLWTGEAWSNGQILWALAETDRFPRADARLAGTVVRWFRASQGERGDWSGDVDDTASAIIGLCNLLLVLERAFPARSVAAETAVSEALSRDPAPQPRSRRPLVERHEDNYTSINLSPRARKILYVAVGVATALGTIGSLWDFIAALLGR